MLRAHRLLVLVTTACVGLITGGCTDTGGNQQRTSPTSGFSSNSGTAPVDLSTMRYSLGGATVVIPVRWFTTPYHGEMPTVSIPITFLTSSPMTGRCATGRSGRLYCTTSNWFPPNISTPPSGVLVVWVAVLNPTEPATPLPGRPTRINNHRAWVDASASSGGCPYRTAQEIDAYVRIATKPFGPSHYFPSGHLDMTACLGADASPADRAAVTTMLNSLRIDTKFWY